MPTPLHFTTERRAAIIAVTPELAENWLKANTRNRTINRKTVAKYAQSMRDGTFQFNGDTIRFGLSGVLLDAQHRLAACVETGIPFDSVVVWGIDEGAQISMDRGKKRSLIDHLKIMGEQSSKELATVLNLAVAWYQRGERYGVGARTSVSYEEAYEYLRENPNVRESVEAISLHGLTQIRRVLNPAHFAFCHWVLSNIDADDADDFLERIVKGRYESETDPAYRLRERLLDLRSNGDDKPQEVIPLVFKGWNLYRAGDSVKQLRIRRGGSSPEAFPEPK